MLQKKPNIIALTNQKGGVAKTTTAINLAAALALSGLKVLLIDLDPQGNSSTGLGIDQKNREITIYDVLINRESINKAVQETCVENLYIIPADVNLSAAEVELLSMDFKEKILLNSISKLNKVRHDYIIIDCAPSLGQLTLNAFMAANSLIIPIQCEFFALEGLSHLLGTVDLVQKKLNRNLKILGVLLSMYDKRNKLTEEVEKDVRGCLGDLVFDTSIPRNVRISEAPSHGLPVLVYDPNCIGSKAFHEFTKEVILRAREI